MLVDLTRDEIENIIEAVDMRRDSAIDAKLDVERYEPNNYADLVQFIEDLQGTLNKLNNALLD